MTVAFAKTVARLWLKILGIAAALAMIAWGTWFYGKLRGSLPQLDGAAALAGLSAPVTVERDALGVPTIHAANPADAARALGYLHAQDRFFQMDLLRRRAAGELAELFGPTALRFDQTVRQHDFRSLARTVLAREPPSQKALAAAYADGVNAGLAALRCAPFEYALLRVTPAIWHAEDSVLVSYAMTLSLQDSDGRYKHSLTTLWNTLGPKAFAFLAPVEGPQDAALDGSEAPLPPIPPPGVFAVRPPAGSANAASPPGGSPGSGAAAFAPGSNALAVSGDFTAHGGAVLGNDIHLDLGVPNTWYRAQLVWGTHRVTGITLPGAPCVVAGSNGMIAWGFTSSYTDTGDLIAVSLESPGLYRGPNHELLDVERREAIIQVKGAPPVMTHYDWTVWGPIIGTDSEKHSLVYHWTADDPASTNLDAIQLATATTTEEALAIAHHLGISNMNFLVADGAGRIGWTIAGRLPRRVGYTGRLAVSWQYGDRGWKGYWSGADIPTVAAGGYLWSSNQRMLGGDALVRLGDGGPYYPARAAQVRDDLQDLVQHKPHAVMAADLLAIELDDRARFLERWQQLALRVLTPAAIAQNARRAAFRAAVANWGGRASPDSASYRLVREFHARVAALALGPLFAPCREADAGFDWSRFHYEDPLWALLATKPPYLLSPPFANWDDLLLGAVDQITAQLQREGTAPSDATWGVHNTLAMNHPFSRLLPHWLAGWLNMPAEAIPGGDDMPRIQGPSFGASARFAVAPGRGREGVFEMPGGQSGHPLSPFYRAGHEAWVRGEATAFLPGTTVHTLTLTPR